ncbi:MAG: YczE/YyaS/YitT family protein [Actinomycetota bacterium]
MHDAATPRPLRERFFERLARCAAGLFCFGAGIACFVHSDLGVPPWDVFHTGISKITGLQLGNVIIVVGVALLVLWIPLRIRPGIGTIMNAVQIGLVENFMEDVLPDSRAIAARVAYLAAGMLFIAFGSGLYIGAELGSGPRDGLMIGVNKRFGISIRLARTIVEIVVMVTGIFLGGRIGLGTFVFAFGIGPMVQVAMAALRMSPSLADEATGEALET